MQRFYFKIIPLVSSLKSENFLRTAQAGKTSENQSQVQIHSAEKIHTAESDEEFRQLINAKRQRICFPPASKKEQWEALDSKIVLQLDKLIGRALWSTNLPLSVTFSTRYVLTPSGLNISKLQENLRKVEGNVRWKPCESRRKQMKSATEEEKSGLQELWRGLNARHSALSRIRKEETKSKEKESGTLLQRPISVCKTTLPGTKIRFPFSTGRTAGDPSEENIFRPK